MTLAENLSRRRATPLVSIVLGAAASLAAWFGPRPRRYPRPCSGPAARVAGRAGWAGTRRAASLDLLRGDTTPDRH
jgi:hypothetical protein